MISKGFGEKTYVRQSINRQLNAVRAPPPPPPPLPVRVPHPSPTTRTAANGVRYHEQILHAIALSRVQRCGAIAMHCTGITFLPQTNSKIVAGITVSVPAPITVVKVRP